MISQEQLLKKCIEQVGREWNEMEDVGFYNEADLRARLLSLLWSESDLVKSIPFAPAGKIIKIPLAHAECLGTKGRKIGYQGAFDIAVFTQNSMREWAQKTRWEPNFQKEAVKLDMAAAMEIKVRGWAWDHNIKDALAKLLERMSLDPIKNGYLIIFYDAKKQPMPIWANVMSEITQLRGNKNVKIYFAPCNDQSVQARWI